MRGVVALPLLVAASVVAGLAGAHGAMSGRPLADVLAELRAQGLDLIWSSAIVAPEMILTREPAAGDPRAVLDEILASFGLAARDEPSGAILIVRAPLPPERPVPLFVEQVLVTPGHHEIVPRDVETRHRLDRRDVTLAPTLGSDPSRSVALLPGIASADASAAFHPRGAASIGVSTILDGLELYAPFHLDSFQRPFSVIDARLVESVDFTGGGFTADRGDRNGGFVEMSTVAPAERATAQVELGTLNSRIAFESMSSPLGPLLVSGRYWYPEAAFETTVFGPDGLQPSFGDVYVKAGLSQSPDATLSAHALATAERTTLVSPDSAERVDASSASLTLWLRGERRIGERLATETVLSAGTLRREREGTADLDETAVTVEDDRRVRFGGVRSDASWRIGGRTLVRGGLEARYLAADLDYASGPPAGPATLAVERSGASLAAYAACRGATTRRLTTELGVRWDHQTYTVDGQWSPRFHLAWDAGPRDEVRLALGSYAQSLRIHELRIEDGETDYRPAESSRQIDLTYTHRLATGSTLRLDGYLHRLTRVLPRYENLNKPIEIFPEAEPDRVLVAPERASLEGVEVSLAGNPDARLAWSASYTWSRAEDVIDGASVPRSWDQTHAGKFLASYEWGPGWFAGANGTIHTGWPTTPIDARIVVEDDGSTTIEPVPGARNSDRLPTYARLDLKAGRKIDVHGGSLRIEISVLNATDRDNACCLDEVRFAEQASGAIETDATYDSWLGITPVLQLLWQF